MESEKAENRLNQRERLEAGKRPAGKVLTAMN